MIELQRAIRIAITIAAVIVAVFVVRWMWIHYEREPWTRDGRIRADTVEVASDVTGLVTEVHVIDNSIVRKGQVLFVVDRARYALALAQAEAAILTQEAALAQAESEARRNRVLGALVSKENAEQTVSRVRQLEAALLLARANRDVAKLNLERTAVMASVDGIVTNVQLRPGDYATAGRGVIALIDSGSLHVDGYFEETKLPYIHVGDPVTVHVMGLSQPINGHVQSISGGIADRERSVSETLLPNVNPVFSWVRLAQRIPVRVTIDRVPSGMRLIAGRTATVTVHPQGAPAEPHPSLWP
jgi:multidrug resistance efflux pump